MIVKFEALPDIREIPNQETVEESPHEDPCLKYSRGITINAIANDNLRDIFGFLGTDNLENRCVNKKFAEVGGSYYTALKLPKLINSYLGPEASSNITARWQIQPDGSVRWQHFAFNSRWDFLKLKKQIVLLFKGSSLPRVYDIMRRELQCVKVDSYSEANAKKLMMLKGKVRKQAINYHQRHCRIYKAIVKLITKQDVDVSLKALVAVIDAKIRLSLKKTSKEICSQNFRQLAKAFTKESIKDSDTQDLWVNPETGEFLAVRLSGSYQPPTLLDPFTDAEKLGQPNAAIVQGYAGKHRNYRISLFKELALTEFAQQSMTLMEEELKKRDQDLKDQFPNAREHLKGFVYKLNDPLSPYKTHQISAQDGKILYDQERV